MVGKSEASAPNGRIEGGERMTTDAEPYLSFDRVAECYESSRYIPPAILEQVAEMIVADGRLTRESRVLDVAVGTGRFSRYLRRLSIPVVGVDISSGMLARAAAQPDPPFLIRADVRALPLRTSSFDAALVVHLLHLIGDWKRVVAEIHRVLRPGAPLYLGSEAGKHFATRSIYFQVAAEWKLTRPNLGAESFDAILDYLVQTGAEITRIDGERLTWTARAQVREMMESLRGNPFSHLWHIPPDVHSLVIAEEERRVADVFPDPEQLEEVPASLMVWKAAWR